MSRCIIPILFVSHNFEGESVDSGGSTPPQESAGSSAEAGQGDGGSAAASFSFDSWDGDSNTLPEQHKEAFAAFGRHREASANDQVRSALVRGLNDRYRSQDQAKQQQAQQQAASSGSEPQYMTKADFDRAQANQKRQGRIQSFRDGMIDIVGKPQKYGDATVTFTDQSEVDDFEGWMQGMFNGKLTPQDMLFLYRRNEILQAHSDARIRAFEAKLGGNRQNLTAGNRQGPPSPKSNTTQQANGEGRRVPSLEDFIKQENPDAAAAIARGELSVLENL